MAAAVLPQNNASPKVARELSKLLGPWHRLVHVSQEVGNGWSPHEDTSSSENILLRLHKSMITEPVELSVTSIASTTCIVSCFISGSSIRIIHAPASNGLKLPSPAFFAGRRQAHAISSKMEATLNSQDEIMSISLDSLFQLQLPSTGLHR
jgi:hypothetical protein